MKQSWKERIREWWSGVSGDPKVRKSVYHLAAALAVALVLVAINFIPMPEAAVSVLRLACMAALVILLIRIH